MNEPPHVAVGHILSPPVGQPAEPLGGGCRRILLRALASYGCVSRGRSLVKLGHEGTKSHVELLELLERARALPWPLEGRKLGSEKLTGVPHGRSELQALIT